MLAGGSYRRAPVGTSPRPQSEGPRRARRSVFLITHSIYPDDIRTEKEALALAGAGFDVTVICIRRGGQPAREVAEGVAIHRLPLGHKRGGGGRYLFEYAACLLLAGWRAALLSIARRPLAVHVSNPPDFLVFAALVPKLLGARVVLDMHEPMPELYASIHELPMTARAVRLLAWVERTSTRFADRIVTVSEVCRRTFAARGLALEKIAVVQNVCEARLFDPAAPPLEASGGAVPGVPRGAAPAPRALRLIYTGTVVPRYGVDVAIRAMALLRERVPEARLDVFGRGESVVELERLAEALGVADRIAFHGFIDRRDVPARIAAADIGLVPYRRDVFTDLVLPTKLFEYAAMGKPVVATRTAAIESYFGTEDLYAFEAGDEEGLARAVEAIRARPDAAAARAARLRERLALDTWERAKATYVGVFDRLGAKRRAGR
jgi:glycosyltransferase involved in cell wall biosynthesis